MWCSRGTVRHHGDYLETPKTLASLKEHGTLDGKADFFSSPSMDLQGSVCPETTSLSSGQGAHFNRHWQQMNT